MYEINDPPRALCPVTGGSVTITQFVQVIRRSWVAVVALTILGALVGVAVALLQTPIYVANAQLFVSVSDHITNGTDLSQGGTFAQSEVQSFREVVTSPTVLEPVLARLKLRTSTQALASNVGVTVPLNTVLMDLSVKDASPTRARDIANEIARQSAVVMQALVTPRGQNVSPVRVTVTQWATTPLTPVSPRKDLNLALGLLAGLALGCFVAVARESVDRTVGGQQPADEIANAPILGVIAKASDVVKEPLITHDLGSPRAESFRQLRTNMRSLSRDYPVRSLVVTSSVTGEGKSATATNLAIAFAEDGHDVVLIDANLRNPGIADLLGLPPETGLSSVLRGDVSLDGALSPWRYDLPLRVLTSGPPPPNPSEVVGSPRMAELIRHFVGTGATVILDTPPLLLATDSAVLAQFTDGALLVTRFRSTRVNELSVGASALRAAGANLLGVVVNRVPRRSAGLFRLSTYGHGSGRASWPPVNQRPQPQPQPFTSQDWKSLQGRTSAQQAEATARTFSDGQYR
jgi:polysaccharide biosynthesis transport protein